MGDVVLEHLIFVWWWAFFLLPLPLLLRVFLPPTEDADSDALTVPFFNQIQQASAKKLRCVSWWRALLLGAIWALLVTAVARPTEVGEPLPQPTLGRDVMLAIDLSHSMRARDLRKGRLTRLDVVKASADEFISRRKGDRMGLIFFSDRAYLQAPLTFDHKVVRDLLAEASVGLTGAKTAIGDAIAIAIKRLKAPANASANGNQAASKNRQPPANADENLGDSRVLVLLTDGENTAGVMAPLQAAAIAQKLGIKIYTIGVGSRQRDTFGRTSTIDETTLKAIAQRTGGRYFRATNASTLDDIYREIDKLEPAENEVQYLRPEIARYYYPAGLALALSALYAALSLLGSRQQRGSA